VRFLLLFAAAWLAFSVRAEDALKFVRELTLTNGTVELRTCVRHYHARRQPDIYLVAAMHVGETNYYAALQQMLDAQALVMFEGVGWAEAKEKGLDPAKHRRDAGGKQASTSDLQTELAELLGGVFQLDAIDYDRTNFVNNDMSLSQLKARMQGSTMNGDAFFGMMGLYAAIMKPVMAIVQASPSLRSTVKLLMMDVLAEAGNDIESMTKAVPSMNQLFQVILRDRNELIFSNLTAQLKLKHPPASIALFYGAAHMAGLERRLEKEFNYHVAGEQWLTALRVDPEKDHVDMAMAGYLRGMIKETLETARSQAAESGSATNAVPSAGKSP
jgi:hypothetical protein